MILQLLIAVHTCAIHSPWAINMGIEMQQCAEDSENSNNPTTLVNCFVQIMNNLPDDVVGQFQSFAENVSAMEPEFIFAVETLESKTETSLEDMYPESEWCCLLVANMQLDEQSNAIVCTCMH